MRNGFFNFPVEFCARQSVQLAARQHQKTDLSNCALRMKEQALFNLLARNGTKGVRVENMADKLKAWVWSNGH
jgi:hypothetical protein